MTCEFCDKPTRGIDDGAILGTRSVCWDCLGILVIDERERRDEEQDEQADGQIGRESSPTGEAN